MPAERASLDIDALLRIILVLVIVWLAIEILEGVIGFLLPGPLSSLVGLVLLALIVAWYLDVI